MQTIQTFLKEFGGELDVSEAAEPVEDYKTFNEFFYRKLKPGARPIAALDRPDVMVSGADCRLTAFNSVSDATRCWIKVHISSCLEVADITSLTSCILPLSKPCTLILCP